jgi:holo-[acyl-carrier protein] synthase
MNKVVKVVIKGIGVDIVSLNRIKNNLYPLSEKILSNREKEIFNNLESERRKIEFLGGRYAFKEALFKASKNPLGFEKITLDIDEDGSPLYEDKNVLVSISHEHDYVVAFVVILEE